MYFDHLKKLEDLLSNKESYQSFLSLIDNIPGNIFLSTLSHEILAANQLGITSVGLSKPNEIIGKKTAELPFRGAELAEKIEALNDKVLEGNEKKLFSFMYYGKEEIPQIALSTKKPIYNKNKDIIGIWTQEFTYIPSTFATNIEFYLNATDIYKDLQQFILDLDHVYSDLKLTPRQSEVFFFLIRGKTSKEISDILKLSIRTVEFYTNQIKLKLNCTKKSELVERSIDAGYLGILPESLFDRFK